jgi:hypothetical protein
MAYIGPEPAESFTSFATQEFSTSATTSYTLDHAVANENEIALFVNNVRQQPGSGKAYTATGTALTLSAATASTDTMYCVFLGRALQTVTPATNSITSAMLSGNLVTPGTLDVNGNELILDADADTSITADTDDTIHIKISNTDKLTLTSSVFLYGKTSSGTSVDGIEFEDNGKAVFSRSGTSGGTPMFINRNDNDGSIISIRQADSEEGTISVSGSTVSYNAFTGSHWSRLVDNSKPTILKGTVIESLNAMCDWYNLEFNDNDGTAQKIPHVLTGSQSDGDKITYDYNGTDYEATIVKEDDIKHMKSKVSDTTDAKNVYGVFSSWDEDGEGYNDFYVASVGSFVVRIHKDETVAKGDLLQSNGDGTAKKQSDDNVKSSTFAKVLSNTKIETYSDGSYIVPCSLMC